jgi:PBSX family phage terminase large subunit
MEVTNKYLDFILTDSIVDMVEGTTQAGKTTTIINTKFLYMLKKTSRKKHLIAGESLGTIVSNILNTGDCGLCDIYPDIVLNLNGSYEQKIPHLKIGEDIVYLVGYSDIAKYKKVLGGQFGVVFIDEINIAHMDFIHELLLPRFEYLCGTLNPDNPDKEIYTEVINRCRPIEGHNIPDYIWTELNKSQPMNNWNYWFFTYDDNPSITEERKQQLLSSLLPETREYQTKILGKRTKGTGLIFYLPNDNIITEAEARNRQYKRFSCGIDTSYSRNTDDTFALIFQGVSNKGELIVLEEEVYNNKDRKEKGLISLSPSDMALVIDEFVIKNSKKWGICNTIFIDSADAGTISECIKFKRQNGRSYNIVEAWKSLKIIDRINLQNGWIAQKKYLIVNDCKNHIKEHNIYSWLPNKDEPEDCNDHTINASQYGWIPYKSEIGV